MRADRLVAILLLLQRRGQVTAAEVAAELEVSERTARRDLEALGAAGIPVYAQQGRNGGWRLLGGASTDLTGLNEAEVRALFLVAGPGGAGPAGTNPQLRAALRKLVRALPEPFRAEAEAASDSILVDRGGWDGASVDAAPPPRFLDDVQRAVVQGRCVEMGYVGRTGEASERTVHPLGLAAKGRAWYVVGDTEKGLRTFRVDRIRSLAVTDRPVVRPEGFVLSDAWRMITEEVGERRVPARADVLADPVCVGWMRMAFGQRLRLGAPEDDGRVRAEVRSWNVRQLAGELARFAEWLEVVGPDDVRAELASIGRALTRRYGEPAPG